jgi:hypothetical protein
MTGLVNIAHYLWIYLGGGGQTYPALDYGMQAEQASVVKSVQSGAIRAGPGALGPFRRSASIPSLRYGARAVVRQ